jgi:hypothetical protein
MKESKMCISVTKTKCNDDIVEYSVIVDNVEYATSTHNSDYKEFDDMVVFFDDLKNQNIATKFILLKSKLDEVRNNKTDISFRINKDNWPVKLDEAIITPVWDYENIIEVAIDNIREM